jgi:hypothetical protein
MNTKRPYFYLIQHKLSQRLYAGVKYSNPDSSNFMTETGYKTHSKVVKSIIEEEGLSVFDTITIKHFDTPDAAREYESRYLLKVSARTNPKFLNLSNSDAVFYNKGGYKLSKKTKQRMSKPKSEKHIQSMKDYIMTEEHKRNSAEGRRGTKNTEEAKLNMAKAQAKRFEDENEKLKISESVKKWANDVGLTAEQKAKHIEQNSGKNNGMYGKKHSEETKQKLKDAWAKRKAAKAAL